MARFCVDWEEGVGFVRWTEGTAGYDRCVGQSGGNVNSPAPADNDRITPWLRPLRDRDLPLALRRRKMGLREV